MDMPGKLRSGEFVDQRPEARAVVQGLEVLVARAGDCRVVAVGAGQCPGREEIRHDQVVERLPLEGRGVQGSEIQQRHDGFVGLAGPCFRCLILR